MEIVSDYHIHTKNSPDSKAELYDICKKAIQMNMSEIAITDHFEFLQEKEIKFYLTQ